MGKNETDGVSAYECLKELAKNSEKQLFYTRISAFAMLTAAAVMIACLVALVPKAMQTIGQANEILLQASETIELADTAIESVTEMSQSITFMGSNMDDFIADNAQSVQQVMKEMESIDFEGLNRAIKDLQDVVEPFAKFFGKFKS